MKTMKKITVTMLVLLVAGSISVNAQRGMRGMRTDTARMRNPGMGQMEMPRMMQDRDSLFRGRMGRGIGRMPIPPVMNRNYGFRGQFYGRMQPGWGMQRQGSGMRFRGMDNYPGMRQGMPGMRAMENIPDLTDQQKQQIQELRKKQQDEMQKLRTETQEKMKQMRESQRAKVRELLNDEQKKWFDGNTSKPEDK